MRSSRKNFNYPVDQRYGVLGHLYKLALMNPERLAFVLHRITGMILLIYLMLHVYVTGLTLNPSKWNAFLNFIENPLVRIGEWIVASSLIFHGLNGIRLIFIELLGVGMGKPRRKFVFPLVSPSIRAAQRKALYAVFILSAIGSIIAAYFIILEGGL